MSSTFPELAAETKSCPKCRRRVHTNGFCDDHNVCWTDCGSLHYYRDGVAVIEPMNANTQALLDCS